MSDWQRLYVFNVDQWFSCVKHLCPKTKFIKLSIQDTILLLHGVSRHLEDKINKCIGNKEVFFKLSTRSGKDAWQVIDPTLGIDEEDDIETRKTKAQKQLDILRVSSCADIVRIIKVSERLQDDLNQYINHATPGQTMCIVLQEWRPSQGIEYRCFIKNNHMIACCQYSTYIEKQSIPHDQLQQLVNIVVHCGLPFTDFVLDAYVHDNKAHFIEFNPFDEDTDPIEFTWIMLRNM